MEASKSFKNKYDKEWYKNLNKSKLTPPDNVFGIVWSILYLFMFIAILLVVLETKKDTYDSTLVTLSVSFFSIQLFLGFYYV